MDVTEMKEDSLIKEPCPAATVETQKTLHELSDEQLNRKIAKLCGWKDSGSIGQRLWWHDDKGDGPPPEYCRNLNACHDFEKEVLYKDVMLYMAYGRLLSKLHGDIDAIFCSARQRCEAFAEVMTSK